MRETEREIEVERKGEKKRDRLMRERKRETYRDR